MNATCRRSSPRSLTSTRRRPVTTLDSPAIHTYRSSVCAGLRLRPPRPRTSTRASPRGPGRPRRRRPRPGPARHPAARPPRRAPASPSGRAVPRQPDDLDPGRRRQLLDVVAQRHLDQRRTDSVGRQVAQDPGDRRQRGLVADEQDPAGLAGRELDPAVLVAATRGHRHEPVADLGAGGPGAARSGLAVPVVVVQHDVDHQPGVLARPDDVADRVGPHVAALLDGALEPACPTRSRRRPRTTAPARPRAGRPA